MKVIIIGVPRRIPEKRLEQDMLWLYQGIFVA